MSLVECVTLSHIAHVTGFSAFPACIRLPQSSGLRFERPATRARYFLLAANQRQFPLAGILVSVYRNTILGSSRCRHRP